MNKQLAVSSFVPEALSDESPTAYADRLGRLYGECIDNAHRKTFGHYMTPMTIASFMGSLCRDRYGSAVRILDPAAGAGILAAGACEMLAGMESLRHIELVCYEVDIKLRPVLNACLLHISNWLGDHGIKINARVEWKDFLLANAEALDEGMFPSNELKFDIVICNPPYFKLSKSDPRARACASVVHGQPNIYGLFMAVSAAMLRKGGRFVFITPRSFASGPYFRRFRELFFSAIRPSDIHVFGSRTEAFDEVLQETVITAGIRENNWDANECKQHVRISTSAGANDIELRSDRKLPLSEILRGGCSERVLHLPANAEQDYVRALVNAWPGSLHRYGWEVSTGPVVAFRARPFLRNVPNKSTVPLLWLQHVSMMETAWPIDTRKAQYLVDCEFSSAIVLPNRNYVLLRRFSAKEERRRLTAAPYLAKYFRYKKVGFENHLNYVHKTDDELSQEEVFGLAALLNSRLLDMYFRISSGNTQVSATELRALPLPKLAVVKRIGRQIIRHPGALDAIVMAEAG